MHKRLAALLLIFCLLFTMAPAAYAATDLRSVDGLYAKQQTASTCTLASAAMMMRRRAYLDGVEDWASITEGSLRRVAWSYVGLSHEFTMQGITVQHGDFESDTSVENQLMELLKQHPEGIVVYDRRVPHAILVTDYTDGQFYCSDPSSVVAEGRIPASQATISISKAQYYWYVAADTNRPIGVSGTLTATELVYPARLGLGSDFDFAGKLSSPGNITNVRITLQSDSGNVVVDATAQPNAPEYDLSAINDQLDLSSLNVGNYTMQITADDDYGARICLRKQLIVIKGDTTSAVYSGKAPELSNINAVNLVQTGFDVECVATDEDGTNLSVVYSAWADGNQFTISQIAQRNGDTYTTHIDADASLLGIDSFLINITVMDTDGNSARGALLVKVGVEEDDAASTGSSLVADQKVM